MTFLIFFIILAILIISHEFGHFLFAKLAKVKVEEFGFGFPPKIFWFKKGETIYSFNLFPIGGFVKILGENDETKDLNNQSSKEEDSGNFSFKPLSVKIGIIAAGVFFNFLLAWIIFSFGSVVGFPTEINDEANAPNAKVLIVDIAKNSPAEKVGLIPGDIITRLLHEAEPRVISKSFEVREFVSEHKGEEITIFYERGNETFSLNITPRISSPEGEGALGVAMARVDILKTPFYKAPWEGFKRASFAVIFIAGGFYNLFADLFSGVNVSGQIAGPVGIFSIIKTQSQFGIMNIINFTALLSLVLVVVNILPFPALDGGRILFLIIEKLKGSPINAKVANAIHTAGFALLLLLMLVVTYNDIMRL